MSLTPQQKFDELNALDLGQIQSILQACIDNDETDTFMSGPKAYIENNGYTFPYTYDYYDGIKNPATFVDQEGTTIIWPRPITTDHWQLCLSGCYFIGINIGFTFGD